jgi:two-component system cell cycle sensor histidine kinase/response regulator CckA
VTEIEGRAGQRDIYLTPSPDDQKAGRDPLIFEALPVALLRLDANGAVVAANQAARAMIGEPPEGALLSTLFDGLGRPVADWLRDALAGRAERRPETLRLKTEGEETFVQVTLARTSEGGRPGLAAILTDATQIKTLEAQVVQSQKMQAIGQLAGGVAHDFNNLLTAISGHCDLLLLRHDHGDPDYADLNQIAQNANRAAALVSQLLAFSRKQTLRPAVIDLRDALADLTHLLNRLVGEQVTLTLQHDPDLHPVRVDRRQLEQVVMNLVVNARDAMPRGGRVTLTTRNLRLEADLRRDRATVPSGDYVLIEVRDEGCGILPDRIDKIFEPFFTTKRPGEGTGLGPSTAYGIVKQSGGFLFCDSVVDQGTLFTLYFPASDQTVAEPALPDRQTGPGPAATAGGAVGSVLLVEDEAPVRAFAGRALRMRGFTVVEAENAEEALRILDDRGLLFDLFVTDVIMPGLDGPAWVRRALEDRPGTRVVFMSGYAEESLADARDRIPDAVFLPKPFTLSELTATVQRQMQ